MDQGLDKEVDEHDYKTPIPIFGDLATVEQVVEEVLAKEVKEKVEEEKVEEEEVGDLYPVTFQDRPRHLVNPSLGVQATGTSGLIG